VFYVVELSPNVLRNTRFRKANPQHNPKKPCVYVGMTGWTPERRFEAHKNGYKANGFVRKHGLRLMPELYECFNPMPYEAARELEEELAAELRENGYAVWQN
jgi:predicted GIY-YIG superfamily endonuclease